MKIYLIKEANSEKYKIGYTSLSINERIKQLQTGNAEKLETVHLYNTRIADSKIKKLESAIHAHFKLKRKKGEWFFLTKEDISNFLYICEKIESNIMILQNLGNPFL